MHEAEKIILTNMCVIEDKNKNVLAIDKVTGSYRGTTFPGGHIERGEIFNESIIREVKEETGIDIKSPKLCGVYHWYKDEIHYILFVYHAKEFTGNIKSSREGRVYWINLEQLKKKKLATGTEHIISMVEDESINECFMKDEGFGYRGRLY